MSQNLSGTGRPPKNVSLLMENNELNVSKTLKPRKYNHSIGQDDYRSRYD